MPRIDPIPRADLTEFEDIFATVEANLGVLPNSTLTMAHRPDIMRAFAALNEVVMGPGSVDSGLKQLVAAMVSNAAGCRYCQAHTSHVATKRGVQERKIQALFEFETSDLFTSPERAALRVARGAGRVPNEVTDSDFAELRRHFSDQQCVELVAVMATFGFLNRWNDTMATELEQSPLAFAREQLAASGWEAGKHAAASRPHRGSQEQSS